MRAPDDVDTLLRQGRGRSWRPFLVALALLVGFVAYGLAIYDSIPDPLPVSYGPRGEPTSWEEKSVGVVLMPLLLSVAGMIPIPAVAAMLPTFTTVPDGASAWTRLRIEGSIRGTRSGLGWAMVLVVLLVGGISVHTWQLTGQRLTMWPVALFLVALFAVLWLAYRPWVGWARRTAQLHGIHPTAEEEAEERLWLPLGIYNDPEDPRVFPPKRAGYGMGTTVNWGRPAGKAFVVGIVLVAVVPLVLVALFA